MSSLLASIKPFAPLILTFFLPRVINLYRSAKVAYKTRPPLRPLPKDAARAVNILFCAACLFFTQMLGLASTITKSLGLAWFKTSAQYQNIFWITNSRLKIPTDLLFSRLADLRHDGILTEEDELLKSKIASIASRRIYLRYGPATLMECTYCTPNDPRSYLLHYLPLTILLPYLVHLMLIGLATSSGISGPIAASWRTRFTISSILVFTLDVLIATSYEPSIDMNLPSPTGIYWTMGTLRPLLLTLLNMFAALLIYAGATNRFVMFLSPLSPSVSPKSFLARQAQTISQLTVALQMATTRLTAYHITRNAVVRDERLKERDDEYWRTVIAMEGPRGSESVWEDEEVRAAVARVLGRGGHGDVERMNDEARRFVAEITAGLERTK